MNEHQRLVLEYTLGTNSPRPINHYYCVEDNAWRPVVDELVKRGWLKERDDKNHFYATQDGKDALEDDPWPLSGGWERKRRDFFLQERPIRVGIFRMPLYKNRRENIWYMDVELSCGTVKEKHFDTLGEAVLAGEKIFDAAQTFQEVLDEY